MESANFPQSNAHLNSPPGLVDVCDPVFIHRDVTHPISTVISCWKPTQAEIDEIQRTGRVWLRVAGVTMPPVEISGHSPFAKED